MKLSPRQKQIANLIADDVKAPEIASRLGIAVGSVRTQIVRLKKKKGFHTRLQVAKYIWNQRDKTSRIYKGIQSTT